MRNCFFLLLIVSLVFTGLIQAQTQMTAGQEARIQELEKICKQQEEQINTMQKRLGILENDESYKEYTHKIVKEYLKQPAADEDEAGIVAGYEDGFFIRTADGNYRMNITGFVQMGVGVFENNTFDNNSFYPNGVYLAFDVYIFKQIHGRVEVDFANVGLTNMFQNGGTAGVAVQDAYLEYSPMPEAQVRVGNTHVPFSLEGQYGPTQGITIWSAPYIASWSHGRDPGVMIHGLVADMIEYKASVHNGAGSNTLNTDDNMLVAGQVRVYFLGHKENPNTFFHIGALRSRTTNGDNDNAGPNSAYLLSPWGRKIFDSELNAYATKYGTATTEEDATRGWKTAIDVGARFDKDLANGANIRVEAEGMYVRWERDLTTGRLPFLYGWGATFAAVYRHPIVKEHKGSGIMPAFKFSFADVDNKDSNHTTLAGANIRGQRVYTYTAGLGYAFNSHLAVNFNWVIMDVENAEVNPPKASLDREGSDDLEHAWFVQFTASW
jgi:hypothetical protein